MSLSFVTMTDRQHADQVLRLMHELYSNETPELGVDPAHFPATIERLLAEPSQGRVLLFMREGVLAGYALLIPYWSNEFGGTVLLVDEILVEKAYRGQGIARAFFGFIAETPPFEAVALALEVSPKNDHARALYEALGFQDRSLRMMTRRLSTAV